MWRLFAYMDDDETGERDESRLLADWQVEDVLRWCRFRGYDHIYLTRTTTTARFQPAPVEDVRHVYFGGRTCGDHASLNTEGSVA